MSVERRRAKKLQDKYGITMGYFDALVAAQNGVCAICAAAPPAQKKLFIDHDHSTGHIRGLLCSSCNTGIGCFKDNVGHLAMAIEYLRTRMRKAA